MASLLDPDPGLLSGPLLPVGDVTPDVLRPDPQADALGQMYSTISDYMTRQQAESARMGLWDDQTGLPTSKGLLDAIGQTGTAVALGTGGGGDAPAPGFTAYHGSPHAFDQFDLSKIGTGEGAQAYGHGMYLADSEGVARSYRDMLGTRSQDLTDPNNLAAWMYHKNMGNRADAITELETSLRSAQNYPKSYQPGDVDRFSAALDQLKSGAEMPAAPGHMYEVNVNADPAMFLDWDKPLSEQHPDVQAAVNGLADNSAGLTAHMMSAEKNGIPLTGQSIVSALSRGGNYGDPAVAAALQQAGIPGIRYLDQGSRGAGTGTKNSVVFDANTMDIIRRYGLAGLMAGGGAAALGGQSGQQQ